MRTLTLDVYEPGDRVEIQSGFGMGQAEDGDTAVVTGVDVTLVTATGDPLVTYRVITTGPHTRVKTLVDAMCIKGAIDA